MATFLAHVDNGSNIALNNRIREILERAGYKAVTRAMNPDFVIQSDFDSDDRNMLQVCRMNNVRRDQAHFNKNFSAAQLLGIVTNLLRN